MPEPTPPSETINIERLLEILLRRRWFVIIPFCIAMIAGIFLAYKLPRLYKAQTLILVQAQRVPEDFVRSLVSGEAGERVSNISQQIMSRTNLERIIKEFNLFSGPKDQNVFIEDKIQNLTKRISVEMLGDKRNRTTDAFSISYKGEDPQKVMRIANELATYFIDENLKVREAQAIGTSDFLDDELNTTGKRLIEHEKILKEYREKFMGGLPEQLDSNLRILDRLQEQFGNKQENINILKNSMVSIDAQLREEQEYQKRLEAAQIREGGASGSRSIDDLMGSTSDPAKKLGELKLALESLKGRYTDQHPDMVRLKSVIAQLEATVSAGAGETAPRPAGETRNQPIGAPVGAPFRQRIQEMRYTIATDQADIAQLQKQIAIYQQRVEDTPKREQELLSLQRGYQNIKESYNSLLQRRLEAEISVNMEKKQKGEQFRIVDPARLPTKPVEPDLRKLFLLCVAAGFALGGGLIFAFEFMDNSLKDPGSIEAFLGFPVLATIPKIEKPWDRKRQKLNAAFSIVSILFSLVLFAGFALVIFMGPDQVKAMVRTVVN